MIARQHEGPFWVSDLSLDPHVVKGARDHSGVFYKSTNPIHESFTFMHWRRKWQLTPVFLPGESQGRGSLVGCCLWGRTESDTTEATWQQQQQQPVLHFASVWAFSHLFKCSPTVFPFYKLRLQHGLPEVTQLVANIAGNKVKHLDPSLALAASSEIHSAWVFSDK